MPRSIHVIAEAKVKGQILAELKIILDIGGAIVLVPPGNDRGKMGSLLLRKAQQETSERVPSLGVACLEGCLDIAKFVVRRVGGAVETNSEVIEQRRTDGFVASKKEVVGEPRLEKIRVEGRREDLVSVKLFLVAAAVGEEEFIAVSPVLVNTETHGGVQKWVSRVKDEVFPQRISSIWIRVNRQVGKHLLRDRADVSDLVAGEGEAATEETSGT